VIFSHDTEHALLAIVGLVNTSPELAGGDGLPDVDALAGFVGA
jgi:hypothetical protein